MIRLLLSRFAVFGLRIGGVVVVLVLCIEIGFGWLGGSAGHLWETSLFAPVRAGDSAPGESAWRVVNDALKVSALSLAMALPSIWLIGFGWGILGARFRIPGWEMLLRLPFAVAGCFPGFWIVILVAMYSYLKWERPGFADEWQVEQGPNLLPWWNAAVVALPLILAGASRQMRGVREVLSRHGDSPIRRAFFLLGYPHENVFYEQVVRPAKPDLVRLIDLTVPMTLGGLVVVETAFQQPGLGRIFVEAIRSDSLPVVFLSSLCFALLGSGVVLLREILALVLERRAG